MSAPVDVPVPAADAPSPVGAPSLRNLLRSEWLRARSRRSLWWLTGLTLLGVLAMGALLFRFTAAAGPDDLAAAQARFMAEQLAYYEECVELLEPGLVAEEQCWKPTEQDAAENAAFYLDPGPFLADDFTGMLGLAGGLAAVVSLLVAASSGGADWGARTMGLLLSWEPRRLRVFLVRLGVTLMITLVFTALAVGLAYGLGRVIADMHGWEGPASDLDYLKPPDLGDMGELALRWLPISLLAAAAGYGVAMLTRSTGWAIGGLIAFGVVLGPFVMGLWAWGSQWLPQVNAVAWLQGGTEWAVNPRLAYTGEQGGAGWIWLSSQRAMLTLVVMVLALLAVAAVSMRSRDVD